MAPSDSPTDSPEASGTTPPGVAEASTGAGGYRVKLPDFEGPLDLLLHLIREHQIDIFDIPISFVAKKYVEFITLMEELNIDVASEYLVMAATLTHIKSRMLLPTPPAEEEDGPDFESDPRAELVRRLLEYQKYKDAAEQLGDRSVLGRDIFLRGASAPSVEGPAPLLPVGLFKLLDAFQDALKRARQSADHEIDVDRLSISDRINELADILRSKVTLRFDELFTSEQTRSDLIVTFLALLEMTRVRMVRLSQDGPLQPILIELAVEFGDEPLAAMEGSLDVEEPVAAASALDSTATIPEDEVEDLPFVEDSSDNRAPSESSGQAETGVTGFESAVGNEPGELPVPEGTESETFEHGTENSEKL